MSVPAKSVLLQNAVYHQDGCISHNKEREKCNEVADSAYYLLILYILLYIY